MNHVMVASGDKKARSRVAASRCVSLVDGGKLLERTLETDHVH